MSPAIWHCHRAGCISHIGKAFKHPSCEMRRKLAINLATTSRYQNKSIASPPELSQ